MTDLTAQIEGSRQHEEAAQVAREEAGEVAPECGHFGCTNRTARWSPNSTRYNRMCNECLEASRQRSRSA